MKQQETKIAARVMELTTLGRSHQQAIEELTEKLIITTTNLNVALFRMAVTERLVKEKLGITPEEIEAAAMHAIEDDRAQRSTAAAQAAGAAPQNSEVAAMQVAEQTGLPAEADALRPRLLQTR